MSRIRSKAVALICLALIATIALFAWAILRSNRLDTAAQEIALLAAEDSFSAENSSVLLDNAHPDYLANLAPEQLLSYLNNIKPVLGSLTSLRSISGSTDIPLIAIGGREGSASYEILLSFENSPASILIEMQLRDNRWLFTQFDIYADILAN